MTVPPEPRLSLPDLVLARLMVAGDAGQTRSELGRSLAPLGAQSRSRAEWRQALADSLDGLAAAGRLTIAGRGRVAITAVGREAAIAALGAPTGSEHPRWRPLRDTYLVARALGLPPPDTAARRTRLGSADGLRAAILWARHDLPLGDYPTITEARDALLWRHLMAEGTAARLAQRGSSLAAQPFTQGRVILALLQDLLGSTRPADWQTALRQVVTRDAGARRSSPDALRLAIIGTAWEPTAETQAPPPQPQPQPQAEADIDYPAFAREVRQAAERSPSGRFGDDKVFINHAWKQLRADGKDRGLDLASFKRHLLEASRRELLILSRADMAYSMNQGDVADSTIHYLDDTLHFLRLN